jgi:uncharacterized protein YuzE
VEGGTGGMRLEYDPEADAVYIYLCAKSAIVYYHASSG